ncbi:MAG: TonB family protein [Calditrichaeota bacterium]|nr:TonB family protein [Calditrichota bacterium]
MADNVKSKIAIKEPSILAVKPPPRNDETFIFGFPKEFKKDWIGALDVRFLGILLATFLVEVGIIFFLTSVLKTTDRPANIEKIQKQFAHLLLDNAHKLPRKTVVKAESNARNFLDQSEAPAPAAKEVPPAAENAISIARSNRAHYGVAPLEQRRAVANSDLKKSAIARKVSQTGILRYIISSSNSGYEEELGAIYANGDANAALLEKLTEKVDVVRFRSSGAMFQPISAEQLNTLDRLKGSSVEADLSEEMASLNAVDKIIVQKEKKVEKLDYQRDELLQPAKSSAKVRPADQVAKVIQSHARAIQNCYQQAMRQNPGLKGKVTVRISVSPAGRVADVKILDSTIQSERMLRCIVSRIRRWRNFGRIDDAAGVLSYRQSYVFGY